MKVTIEITTDNAAFDGSSWGYEVKRILAEVSRLFETYPHADHHVGTMALGDVNGNRVGFFSVEEEG